MRRYAQAFRDNQHREGGFGLQGLLVTFSAIAISTTGVFTAGLLWWAMSQGICDLNEVNDNSLEACFHAARDTLAGSSTDLMFLLSSSLRTLVAAHLERVVTIHAFIKESVRGERPHLVKDEAWLLQMRPLLRTHAIVNIESAHGAGISVGNVAVSQLQLSNGTLDSYWTTEYRTDGGRSDVRGGVVPGTEYSAPITLSTIRSITLPRDPRLFSIGDVKWLQLERIGTELVYSLTSAERDYATPSQTGRFNIFVYLSVRKVDTFLRDVAQQTLKVTGKHLKLYTCIALNWVSERLAALGDFAGAAEMNQTSVVTGVSQGKGYREENGTIGNHRPVLLPIPVHDIDLEDTNLRGIAQAINGNGGYAVLSRLESKRVYVNEEPHIVAVSRLQDDLGIDWWFVVAVSEQEMIGEAVMLQETVKEDVNREQSRVTSNVKQDYATISSLVLAVVLVGVVVSVLVSTLIARPIEQIQSEMCNYGTTMSVPRARTQLSLVRQVRLMQLDFDMMLRDLDEYKAYVPAAILAPREEKPKHPPTGQVTILVSDIENCSALWRRSNTGMGTAVEAFSEITREACEGNEGYEVRPIGDGLLLAFSEPWHAVGCALDILEALAVTAWPVELDLSVKGFPVKIGVNYGHVIAERNPLTGQMDYRGETVEVAAQLAHDAIEGTACLSEETFQAIPPAFLRKRHPVSAEMAVSLRSVALVPQGFAERVSSLLRGGGSAFSAGRSSADKSSIGFLAVETLSGSAMSDSMCPSHHAGPHPSSKRTGLQLAVSWVTVGVCRMEQLRPAKVFDTCNLILSKAAEAASITEGSLGTVTGDNMVMTWNATKTNSMHVSSGLRCAVLLEGRVAPLVRVGLATGQAYHGNVGTHRRRFQVTFGLPIDLAHAVVSHAKQLDAFCLIADSSPQSIVNSDGISNSCLRLIDSWYHLLLAAAIPVYHLVSALLTVQLDTWNTGDTLFISEAASPGPCRNKEDSGFSQVSATVRKILHGGTDAVQELEVLAAKNPGDVVLKRLSQMYGSVPCHGMGYRCTVTLSSLPPEASFPIHVSQDSLPPVPPPPPPPPPPAISSSDCKVNAKTEAHSSTT